MERHLCTLSINTYLQTNRPYTIPARPAGNFRVFPQLTTDYFVKQGEKSFPAMADNLKSGKNVVEPLQQN